MAMYISALAMYISAWLFECKMTCDSTSFEAPLRIIESSRQIMSFFSSDDIKRNKMMAVKIFKNIVRVGRKSVLRVRLKIGHQV